MMNLTILPSRGAKPDFGGKPPTKADFESDPAGAKGLAPPGSAPPPKPKEKALGEEGATREPIAPTQDLDFSPKIDPKNLKIDAEGISLNLESALMAEVPEEAELPIPLPKEYDSGFSLAAVAVMGPIVISAEVKAELPLAQTEGETYAKPADAVVPRTTPVQFADRDFEVEPVESKDPPRLVEDVCPVGDPPVRGEKDKSSETKSDRGAIVNPDVPLQKQESKPDTRPATRQERLDKLAAEEAPPVESVQVEAKSEPVAPKLDLEREAALKAKAADQHAAHERVDEKPIPVAAEPSPKTDRSKVKAKADDAERTESIKGDGTKADGPPIRISKKGANDSGDAMLNRGKPPETRDAFVASPERSDAKPVAPQAVVDSSASAPKAAAESKSPERTVPDLAISQRESVIRQVVDRVESLAATSPRRNVTIHLDPRELGSITLVVKRNGSEVDTEIYASHEAVRHALENNKSGLQSGLEQRGIHLASMNIGAELPNSSGRQEQAAKEAAQQPTFTPRSDRNEAPTLTLDAMRNLTRRATGVDLWI